MGAQARAIGEQLREHIASIFKALILEVDKELRASTPVDTGHARANWVPSVGAPHAVEVDGEAAHAAGVAQVLRFKLGDGNLFESNAVDYVPILNYGWSDQAPAMFIEAAAARALATINARYNVRIEIDRTPPRAS